MLILYVSAGYLLGSVPFGRIVALLVSGIDITKKGSGNIGATNVGRELGISWGLLTLMLDSLKGFLPTALILGNDPCSDWSVTAAILAPVIGHQFSIFSHFKGGKGVATALGVWLSVSPLAAAMAVFPFALCVALSGYVSLGSMVSALLLPVFLFLLGEAPPCIAAGLSVAGLVIWAHRDNIKRVIAGAEPKWKKGH